MGEQALGNKEAVGQIHDYRVGAHLKKQHTDRLQVAVAMHSKGLYCSTMLGQSTANPG